MSQLIRQPDEVESFCALVSPRMPLDTSTTTSEKNTTGANIPNSSAMISDSETRMLVPFANGKSNQQTSLNFNPIYSYNSFSNMVGLPYSGPGVARRLIAHGDSALTATCPIHILKHFPRELRDKIYGYVLSSSTGRIDIITVLKGAELTFYHNPRTLEVYEYSKRTGRGPRTILGEPSGGQISMGLVYTCKQIRDETEGLLWKLNTFRDKWETDWTPNFRKRNPLGTFHQMQIRKLQIALKVDNTSRLKDIMNCLAWLTDLSEKGDLKEVVFLLASGFSELSTLVSSHAGPREVYSNSKILRSHCSLFEVYTKPGGKLSQIKRSAMIRSGLKNRSRDYQLDRLSEATFNKETRMYEKFEPRAERELLELHKAIRGPLSIDGVVVYKDNARVAPLIVIKPAPQLLSKDEVPQTIG